MKNNKGCLGFLLGLSGGGSKPPTKLGSSESPTFPYGLRDNFLSPAEISFFHVLKGVLDSRHHLVTKVRLFDIFFVWKPRFNQAAINRIDRKHVDFLICDARTMQPLLGIELDDASHNAQDRVERDVYVEQVFHEAGLPLLRIPAARGYVVSDLSASVAAILDPHSLQKKLVLPPPIPKVDDDWAPPKDRKG